MIDIKGLDKARVLQALYAQARSQGMGFLQFQPGPMSDDTAKRVTAGPRLYFDYVAGRVMKVDLSKDELDPRLYDRDNGQGAAEDALRSAGLLSEPR